MTTLRQTLETLSWIAGIVAVPVAVLIAWLTGGKGRNKNKSFATKGASAISGDVHADAAHIVAGHNSSISVAPPQWSLQPSLPLSLQPWLRPTPRAWLPKPDWPIRDLFFHIDPDIRNYPEKHLWQSVGSDVIDKFSTDQLEVWGRRIDGSRRLALAKIPAEEWQGAKFTYGFLLEDNGQLPDVTLFPPSGEATLERQYADLHVSKIQARNIAWKRRAPCSDKGEQS